jgi:NAD(P)-dependent dehydrogenase (short-subunit alcohol dehydrogenase family)
MYSTQGPTVVITGAAGGIGGATAQLFREAGWATVGVDRQASPYVDTALECDLGDPYELARTVKAIGELPRIDAVVNIAAEQPRGGIADASTSLWIRTMTVNVIAAAEICRAAVPQLTEAKGSVVSVTSVHSTATSKGLLVYSTTKAALAGLMRALAVDLAAHDITVNCVAPGAVDTEMLRDGLLRSPDPDAARDRLRRRIPASRIAAPEEIARLAFLLVQPGFRYITGQEIVIDGGVQAVLSSETGIDA